MSKAKIPKVVQAELKNVQRRIRDCPDLKYLTFTLPALEGRKELLEELLLQVRVSNPEIGLLVASASTSEARYLCSIGTEGPLTAAEWSEASSVAEVPPETEGSGASGAKTSDWESRETSGRVEGELIIREGLFPEKKVDELVRKSFDFLREKGLYGTKSEESEEDYIDPEAYGLGGW
jgi:hypothetical protein